MAALDKAPVAEQTSLPFAQSVWKKLVRFVVTALGLLLLRAILGSLPILKNAAAFGDSFMTPLVLAYMIVDTVILLLVLDFGITLARDLQTRYKNIPDLGKLISVITVLLVLIFAYRIYEVPTACLVVQRNDLLNLGQNQNTTTGNFSDFIRAWNQIVGQVNQMAMQNANGEALVRYQQLAVALLRRPPDIYGWTFLALIALPAIGTVALVSRHLNTFTDLLSHAGIVFGRATQARGTFARSGTPERSSVSTESMSAGDVIGKLSKLKSLLDSGAISRDDFETQKLKLLGQTVPQSKPTQLEDFQRLKSLLDSGALTEEEYKAQKGRLLEQI
ncbi:MAG: SHOCT domain-containing protein [Acidobacteria bacterium]|nr:SHOCT domain-containing protein [Acidobacteriota bacterium]